MGTNPLDKNSSHTNKQESEKTLLKEIHHRVKNNLNIIIGLLELQSQNVEDNSVKEMFRESINRIRSMAIIHEYLFRSDVKDEIDLSDYIESLVDNLILTYADGKRELIVNYKTEKIRATIDMAIPIGLITNEAVTNSIQHAFPDKDKCHIEISLEKTNGKLILQIKDDGIGIPVNIEKENSKTLGFRLIQLLSGQLQGNYKIYNENGSVVTVEIPFK